MLAQYRRLERSFDENPKSSNAEVTVQLVVNCSKTPFDECPFALRQTSLPTASLLLWHVSFKKSAESRETKANAERGAPKETREPILERLSSFRN